MKLPCHLAILSALIFGPPAGADESVSTDQVRAAIRQSLPILEASSRVSADERSCYTCHNQGLPILTFVAARKLGFDIDEENLDRQVEHTAKHLERGRSSYLKGKGQGGKADTAGSALWALNAAGYPRDEITDAVVEFLLQWNGDKPYWQAQSNRPPSEGSRFTSTFLALSGLGAYGFDEKREAIQKRQTAARDWVAETAALTTEDHVFRLRTLVLAGGEKSRIEEAAQALLALQRDDGGWAQLEDLESDAYATGSALVALREAERLEADSENYRRGAAFLLNSQKADGSWHVVSRSRPIQEPYETGFPHGKDQFISSSGTAWASLALLDFLTAETAQVPKPKAAP